MYLDKVIELIYTLVILLFLAAIVLAVLIALKIILLLKPVDLVILAISSPLALFKAPELNKKLKALV